MIMQITYKNLDKIKDYENHTPSTDKKKNAKERKKERKN